MKKIYAITTLALALVFVFTACQKPDDESSAQNESIVSQESQITESQPEASEPEASEDNISVPETSEPKPEASEPEPETSETEESDPTYDATRPVTPEVISVPEGYEEILSLIEGGEQKKAYLLLKEKKNDIYATQLLANFKEFYAKCHYQLLTTQNEYLGGREDYYEVSVNEHGYPVKRIAWSKYHGVYDSNSKTEYSYTEDGRLLKNNGDLVFYYDEQGTLIKRTETREDYSATMLFWWNDNGLLDKTEETTHTGRITTNIYVYDSHGRIIRWDLYYDNEIYWIQTWEHDEQGRIARLERAYKSGGIENNIYSYNNNGDIEKIQTLDADGNTSFTETYTYDGNGNLLINEKLRSNGDTYFRYEYEYDSKGNCIKRTGVDDTAVEDQHTTHEYTYDDNGNLIKHHITYSSADGNGNYILEYRYNEAGDVVWKRYTNPNYGDIYEETYEGYSAWYHKYSYFYRLYQ